MVLGTLGLVENPVLLLGPSILALSIGTLVASNCADSGKGVMQRTVDREQIDRLVLDGLPAALRFSTRLTGDPMWAEEVVQESLLRVLKHYGSYSGGSSFQTWWMRIVINVYRDQARRHRPSEPLAADESSDAAGPQELAVAAEMTDQVLAEIGRLAPRQREVAVVCLCEGCTPQEASVVLGVSVNNVNVTLHGVRQRIAEALGLTSHEAR